MSENEETSLTQNGPFAYTNVPNEPVFHAVYIPEDNNGTSEENTKETIHVYQDKAEALKVMKEFKTSRLRTFKKYLEAEDFAKTGFDNTTCINSPQIIVTTPTVQEESHSFKSLRSQDLVRFRKVIESGDLKLVDNMVWTNPRYLISYGDTPTILHEGCRFNALHVAVRAEKPDICEFILRTVRCAEFFEWLYGKEDCKSYVDRAEIMLDMYLNTPDKGLNETPLHIAVKFGLIDVVRILVSYPQCLKNVSNKFKQLPIDIICNRKYQDDEILKKDICMLLEEQYYVPVLRSEDHSIQPLIGDPFSPTRTTSYNTDPISPRLEIRAFAGPMTKSQAVEFRRKWKTPPRHRHTPVKEPVDNESNINSSNNSLSLRLQDADKGLERVGRDLAEEYHVPWKEHWTFLNDFADFRTTEGLIKLEQYLAREFQNRNVKLDFVPLKFDTMVITPRKTKDQREDNDFRTTEGLIKLEQYLARENRNVKLDFDPLEFDTMVITPRKKKDQREDNDTDDDEFFTPPSSPKLTVDNSDDEMQSAEEEDTVTFLEARVPTKLDFAVYNAVPSTINVNTYPNIYRWRHEVQLSIKRNSHSSESRRPPRRKLILFSKHVK